MTHNQQLEQSQARKVDPSLFAIVAEGFLSRLSFGIISFALPLYAQRLGMSVLEIGFLIAANEAISLVLKPGMGWVADRFGLKRSYTAAIGLRGLVALLLAFASSPWQLYAIRGVHGVSKALRGPSSSALIAEHGTRKAIASAFAWYHTAKIVAGSFGKTLSGLLLTLTVSNYSFVFAFSFLLSALPLYTVTRYVREENPLRKTIQTAATIKPVSDTQQEKISPLDSKPIILPFTILSFAINGTAEMLRGLFPILATEYAGLSEAQTGLIYTASTLVVLFSGPLFGWLADKGHRDFVLVVRSLGNTISSMVYIVAPNFAGFMSGKLADDIGKAAFRPAWGSLMAYVSSFDKRRRAQTMSWMIAGEDAGTIVAPIFAGFVWSTWGLTAMLGARVLLSIVTEVYITLLNRSLDKGEHSKVLKSLQRILGFVPKWVVRKKGGQS